MLLYVHTTHSMIVQQSLAVVQALGCVLFLLCFNEHPFEDSAKLRIINANYNIPQSDTSYTVFHELIRKCHNFLLVIALQSLLVSGLYLLTYLL